MVNLLLRSLADIFHQIIINILLQLITNFLGSVLVDGFLHQAQFTQVIQYVFVWISDFFASDLNDCENGVKTFDSTVIEFVIRLFNIFITKSMSDHAYSASCHVRLLHREVRLSRNVVISVYMSRKMSSSLSP